MKIELTPDDEKESTHIVFYNRISEVLYKAKENSEGMGDLVEDGSRITYRTSRGNIFTIEKNADDKLWNRAVFSFTGSRASFRNLRPFPDLSWVRQDPSNGQALWLRVEIKHMEVTEEILTKDIYGRPLHLQELHRVPTQSRVYELKVIKYESPVKELLRPLDWVEPITEKSAIIHRFNSHYKEVVELDKKMLKKSNY